MARNEVLDIVKEFNRKFVMLTMICALSREPDTCTNGWMVDCGRMSEYGLASIKNQKLDFMIVIFKMIILLIADSKT